MNIMSDLTNANEILTGFRRIINKLDAIDILGYKIIKKFTNSNLY